MLSPVGTPTDTEPARTDETGTGEEVAGLLAFVIRPIAKKQKNTTSAIAGKPIQRQWRVPLPASRARARAAWMPPNAFTTDRPSG